jgi:hypothetical protein
MTELVKFDFHGDALDVVKDDGGKVWVGVRRVCDVLGLDVEGQRKKLKSKAWAGAEMISVPSPGGAQTTYCIDLDSLPMWLATIEVAKVNASIREKLVRYQKEAARVLAEHFLPRPSGLAKVEAPAVDLAPIVTRLDVFEAKLDALAEGSGQIAAGVSLTLTVLRTQDERVTDLARVLAETREHLAKTAVQKGMISEEQAAHLRREVDALAKAWTEAGWARSVKAAFGEIVQEFFGYVGWGRIGERIDGLPEDRFPRAQAFIEAQRRALRRRGGPRKSV